MPAELCEKSATYNFVSNLEHFKVRCNRGNRRVKIKHSLIDRTRCV